MSVSGDRIKKMLPKVRQITAGFPLLFSSQSGDRHLISLFFLYRLKTYSRRLVSYEIRVALLHFKDLEPAVARYGRTQNQQNHYWQKLLQKNQVLQMLK